MVGGENEVSQEKRLLSPSTYKRDTESSAEFEGEQSFSEPKGRKSAGKCIITRPTFGWCRSWLQGEKGPERKVLNRGRGWETAHDSAWPKGRR